MRLRHFEQLRPVCPCCLHGLHAEHPLRLASIARRENDVILEGILHCSNPACVREYPILDGIPLLLADLRRVVSEQAAALLCRDDLSADLETLLGDCCGQASWYEQQRQHLSIYTWDHYGDLDPAETSTTARPGSLLRIVQALWPRDAPRGPLLDLGCSVGRTAHWLAQQSEELVLGVDLNIAMLRLAQRTLQGTVRYPRRRVGLVYDRRAFAVDLPARARVDFWACDALALPFAPGTFAASACCNLLDCVASPLQLLRELARVLRSPGHALLLTPFDWSTGATPVEAWLGGHSQRGRLDADSAAMLAWLLNAAANPDAVRELRVLKRCDSAEPWLVRLHERSVMHYWLHGVEVSRQAKRDS